MKKISVIVPVYNIEKYIERCIRSILEQSFKNFELLLIDDGSTDNSGSICDQFALSDSRIKVFHQRNRGVSYARNTGIKNAQGSFIAFVDGDDWVKHDYLEVLYEQLNMTGSDICICGGNEVDEHMNELRTCTYQKMEKIEWDDKRLYDWPFFTYVIHRMLVRKQLLEGKSFDETLTNGEDVLFITELFLNASKGVVFLPYVGYSYYIRISGANQHKKYSKKKFSAIIAYEKRLNIMKSAGLTMNPNWYRSFLLEVYRLYGFITYNSEYYDKEHADLLFDFLKKYHVYSDVLGNGVRFRIKYWLMRHFQFYLEHEFKKSELPHGHIVGDQL